MQRVLQEGKHVPTPLVIMNKAGGNQSLAVVYLTQKAPTRITRNTPPPGWSWPTSGW
jgi:hypothetical protein